MNSRHDQLSYVAVHVKMAQKRDLLLIRGILHVDYVT